MLLEQEAPWTALKKGGEAEKAHAGAVLMAALESARIAAVLMAPVVPALASRLLHQLAVTSDIEVPLLCLQRCLDLPVY